MEKLQENDVDRIINLVSVSDILKADILFGYLIERLLKTNEGRLIDFFFAKSRSPFIYVTGNKDIY